MQRTKKRNAPYAKKGRMAAQSTLTSEEHMTDNAWDFVWNRLYDARTSPYGDIDKTRRMRYNAPGS